MNGRRHSTVTSVNPQSVDFLDEDSSSTDFSKLPLAKLECERAPDLELDHSREGLNLLVKTALNVEAAPSCSTSSQNRSPCESADMSIPDSKRFKTNQSSSSSHTLSRTERVKKPQLNFAEILKVSKARKIQKWERRNTPPSLSEGLDGDGRNMGVTPSPTRSNDICTPKKSGSCFWESETASIIASPSSTWTCHQSYDSMSMATMSSSPNPYVAACDSADWGMDPVGFLHESRSPCTFLTKNQIEKRVIQLMIGKETDGYINYRRIVSKRDRRRWHPRTPDPLEEISRRRFNGKVSKWRRKLHSWDFLRSPSISAENKSSVSAEASRLKVESSKNMLNKTNRETFGDGVED